MKVGSTLTYLHSDHLGSTVMETNNSGVVATDEKYFAYGKQRDSGKVTTDHRFTGQKEDGSGLMYYGARFYDPQMGMFVSPDTMVPDAGNVFAYDRYMYAYGNTLKYTDPTGHENIFNCMCAGGMSPEAAAARGLSAEFGFELELEESEMIAKSESNTLNSNEAAVTTEEAAAKGHIGESESIPRAINGVSIATEEILTENGSIVPDLNQYDPGETTGFSGVYDPSTGKMIVRPSGTTILQNGEQPSNSVDQYGGHRTVNGDLAKLEGVDSSKTVGFSVTYDSAGQLKVGWNSGMVNTPNYQNRAAPTEFRQPIMDALHNIYGVNVQSK